VGLHQESPTNGLQSHYFEDWPAQQVVLASMPYQYSSKVLLSSHLLQDILNGVIARQVANQKKIGW
jgi:hypothetical protein